MRLVIARCQVDYAGRLLPVKSDGSVSVHSDDRACKHASPRSRHLSPSMKRMGAAPRLAEGSIAKGWAR
ncbi:hypothetical protein [Amycolatopsis panacis]|uniref:hypothetical protein n=1 Tax=Amycolatopsis panacis TaxID=2340917 RepID=UPI0038996322